MWCSSSEKGALGPGWGLVGNPEEADKDGEKPGYEEGRQVTLY